MAAMNIQGIGIPFKEQVRFETFRAKKGKNKALYLNFMELERDCNNRVSKYQHDLDSYLLNLSRSKTEFIRKQNHFQRTKDLINKQRFKGNVDDSTDESPRYPGEKRVRFPPIVSRSLTTLDMEQRFEVVEEMKKPDEKKQELRPLENPDIEKDFFDRVPEKLYDDSKVRKSGNDASIKLAETRVYVERHNSVFIGIPEGSLDERGISKRFMVPGLLKRWKRNATQPEMKKKRRAKFGLNPSDRKDSNSKLNVESRPDSTAVPDDHKNGDVGKKAKNKELPFHLRILMPIHEESHREDGAVGNSVDQEKNPLITQHISSKNQKNELNGNGRPRVERPQAARAGNRGARTRDQDMEAIAAVTAEMGKTIDVS